MPQGVGWPDVGGYSPALGPLLPPERQVLHQSICGPQVADVEFPMRHSSFQATPTSTVPLGTDVGLLVVLAAVAASLCAAYDVLVYVLNSMY